MNLFPKRGGSQRPAARDDGRSLKNGAYASLLAAVVLAAVILLNLVLRALPTRYTEFDLSESGLFTLSETSRTVARSISSPVTIYYLAQSGEEDANVTRLLDRYVDENSDLRWQRKDPVLYPTFAQQYDGAANGCLIVTSGDRYEVVGYNGLYEMDLEAYYNTGSMQYSFAAENAITTALSKVLREKSYTLYQLTGHGESALESDYTETLSNSGVTVQSLNLLTTGTVPDDADALLINAPTVDLTEAEAETLQNWLDQGGKLFAATSLTVAAPRLDALLGSTGLTRQSGLLVETDADHYAYGYAGTYLLPYVKTNDVTSGMNQGLYVFSPVSHGVVCPESGENGWTYTALLSTSVNAYAMQDYASAQVAQKGENDPAGPFDVAVAAENQDTGSRVVWCGCPNLLFSQMNQATAGGNAQFLGSIVNWFTGEENAAVIESRSMSAESLSVPPAAILALGLLFVIVLPLAVLIGGFIICLIRKRR